MLLPPALLSQAQPFIEAGVLDRADLYTVALIAPLLSEVQPLVQLGLAFAVRAPRFGHVGVDLRTIHLTATDRTAHTDSPGESDLPWPEPATWLQAVSESPAVDTQLARPELPFVLWEGLLHSRRLWTYQDRLAELLRARAAQPLDPDPSNLPGARAAVLRLFPTADPLQRLGALVAVRRRLTLIAGGPGTGKTYTLKRTLALLHHLSPAPPKVALAAPTGKAAVRMAEAIREDLDEGDFTLVEQEWLTSLAPTTLHRLLGFNPANTTRFRHDHHNPLPHDLVVVDEASMVDLPMMTRLVQALSPKTRLILLGDRNQLASVEAGSVFADLTARGGPHLSQSELASVLALDPPELAERPHPVHEGASLAIRTEPSIGDSRLSGCVVRYDTPFRFRPKSGIGRAALAISDGSGTALDRAVAWLAHAPDPPPFPDLHHQPDARPELSTATLDLLARAWRPAIERALAWRPGQPIAPVVAACDSVRVLCAHRHGHRGVSGLNRSIAARLARDLDLDLSAEIVPGLPVLITENRYDLGLMNGDVGVVLRGASGLEVAFLSAQGPRQLAIAQLPAHQRVLAMTIHKSQGSQFDHALLVLPSEPTPLLSRQLVYTGLTRARDDLTLVGSARVLRAALEHRIVRSSRLAERLAGP